MSIRSKKYQDTELQYAALTAICSLIIFALTAIAGAGFFMLSTRLGELVETLTLQMPQ